MRRLVASPPVPEAPHGTGLPGPGSIQRRWRRTSPTQRCDRQCLCRPRRGALRCEGTSRRRPVPSDTAQVERQPARAATTHDASLRSRHYDAPTSPACCSARRAARAPDRQSPVASIKNHTKAKVRMSTSSAVGAVGIMRPNTCARPRAQTNPGAPPSSVVSKASTNKYLMRRERLAPRASRVANSRWRPATRARKRPDTLAHTMTSSRSLASPRGTSRDSCAACFLRCSCQ